MCVVFVFGVVWVVGWYLKWIFSSPPVDSPVYSIWDLCGSLVDTLSGRLHVVCQDINMTSQFVI